MGGDRSIFTFTKHQHNETADGHVLASTRLFKMIVGVQLSSGNSAPNSGNNHHLTIPSEGGMHSFK